MCSVEYARCLSNDIPWPRDSVILDIKTNTEHAKIKENICPRQRTAHDYGFIARGRWIPEKKGDGIVHRDLPVLVRLSMVKPNSNLVTGLAIRFYFDDTTEDLITACINQSSEDDFTGGFSNWCPLPVAKSWKNEVSGRVCERFLSLSDARGDKLSIAHLGGPQQVRIYPEFTERTIDEVIKKNKPVSFSVYDGKCRTLATLRLEPFDPDYRHGYHLSFHHHLIPEPKKDWQKTLPGILIQYTYDVIVGTFSYFFL